MQPKITIKASCISCRTKVLGMYQWFHCHSHNIRYKPQSFYEVRSPRIWSWKKKGISVPKGRIEGASKLVKKLEFAVWRKNICVDATTFVYFCQSECEYCRLLIKNLNKMEKKILCCEMMQCPNTKSSRFKLLQSVILMIIIKTKVRLAAFYKQIFGLVLICFSTLKMGTAQHRNINVIDHFLILAELGKWLYVNKIRFDLFVLTLPHRS